MKCLQFLHVLSTFLLILVNFSSSLVEVQTKDNNAFRANLRMWAENQVGRINKIQKKWKAKLNSRFAEMSDAEFQAMLGQSNELPPNKADSKMLDLQSWRARKMDSNEPTEPIPQHFDAREQWPECAEMIKRIQDQSSCGSCWAASSSSVMQDRTCIGTGGKVKVEISFADVMSCTSPTMGCNGGNSGYAFRRWESHGFCSGSNYTDKSGCKPYPFPSFSSVRMYDTPVCEQKCSNENYTIPYESDLYYGQNTTSFYGANVSDIQEAILESGPVVTRFMVYSDFRHYYSGVYERTIGAKFSGRHAVRIIGWGIEEDENKTPYWLIANSWNARWGDKGYFKIVRGKDECGIEKMGIVFGYPKIELD